MYVGMVGISICGIRGKKDFFFRENHSCSDSYLNPSLNLNLALVTYLSAEEEFVKFLMAVFARLL